MRTWTEDQRGAAAAGSVRGADAVEPGDLSQRSPGANARPDRATRDTAPVAPALPSPTLPKGGGAVRGLGESYTVGAATGTLTISIPVEISPARGLEPTLALRYESGTGNGPYGEGWSLPLAGIARKTDKMLPRYHDDDVYLADGEDLVPALEPDGGAWAQGARDAGTHLIQCFRPRVEAAYDRVERWRRKSDGDTHWRVRDSNGRTHVFGEDATARIADPADTRRVYRWLCERSYDDHGNLIRYGYRAEDRANVLPAVWEQHRAPVYTLIDRILYGVREPYDPARPAPGDPAAYLFEVVFDYGERDGVADGAAPPYAPPATWTVRADPFSSCKPGFEVRCYRLCKRILLFHRIDALGAGPVLVRETRLRYVNDPSLTKLAGVTSIGWRDGAAIAYPEARFKYTAARVDPTVHEIDATSAENLPPLDGMRVRWVDLDGEGVPGAFIVDEPGWFYKRNLGNGALAPVEILPSRPSQNLSGGGQLLDLAGDGVKSLVRFAGPTPGLFVRTEDFGWASFAPFASLPNVAFDDPNLRFIDVDGDGRADALLTEDDLLRCYPSLGYEGFGDSFAVSKPRDEERGPALIFADAEQAIYLVDMTGDGLTDLVRVRNGQVCYWPNLGYGRFGAKITMGNAPHFASAFDFRQANIRLADIDGSGTSDLMYCDGDRVRYWFNLSGNRFSAEAAIAGLPFDDAAVSMPSISWVTAPAAWSGRRRCHGTRADLCAMSP
jgi:hypothetical protein